MNVSSFLPMEEKNLFYR